MFPLHLLVRETDDDAMFSVTALRNGEVSALVMDQLFLENIASWNCDLFTVGQPFDVEYVAFAFPPETPSADVGAFSGR